MSTALSSQQTALQAPPGSVRRFSKRQKAAIVVRLLLSEGAQISLADLPETVLAEITRQMTTLRYVDNETMQSVAKEFLENLNRGGLSFPSAFDGALGILDSAIAPETSARLRSQVGITNQIDPWNIICKMEPQQLLPVLLDESVEVAAVLLSKLKVSTAAELLGLLPGEKARRITYAVSLTGDISPEIVERIGDSLVGQLSVKTVRAFNDDPVDRVGAILNFSPATTRDDVLEGLDQADSGFADLVRKTLFTFADIPLRVEPRDIPKIIREIDPDKLCDALAAAKGNAAKTTEFILANMSQRMSAQLREDMDAAGPIKEKAGDIAMTAVVIAIQELETKGEVTLISDEE